MSSAALLLLVAFGQLSRSEPTSDPTALVRELGAPRYADRQAAAVELERIGNAALPALRAARQSRDMEIRTRAQGLLLKIETALLTQPTSVRLDFDGATLAQVAQSLSGQTGFRIALYPQNLPRWTNQRVTLRHSQALYFWKAVDELCDTASLQYNPSMQGFAGHQDQVFALTEGVIRTLTPISDQGPFRVRLLSIDYQRRLSYVPSGGDLAGVPPAPRPATRGGGQPRGRGSLARLNPVNTEQFTAQLVVAAEPRLSLAQRGELRLVEALDERGNSLIPAARRAPALTYAGYFASPHGPLLETHAQLKRPVDPGVTIKKLRGRVPVTVSSRRPDPLIVPLEKSVGKTFENSDIQLTVHDIRTLPDLHHTLVELSIKTNGPEASPSRDSEAYSSIFQRTHHQLQIDVLDVNDRLVPWFTSSADVENSHVTLTLNSPIQTAPPKELRYFSVARTDVEIPFEFSDIPMP